MSVRASVAVALAERVERTGGPRAGLVAWRALANGADADARGRALASALRCAVTLRDRAALTELSAAWTQVDRGLWDEAITELCKRLVRTGLGDRATALAAAEARRHRTARALYLHARCRELEGEVGAPLAEAFRDAAERAAKEGAGVIERAARVRRAALLAGAWTTLPEALAEAGRLDLGALDAGARISVAAVLLASPSRFVRAGALDALGALLETPDVDDTDARRALVVAASWIDDVGDAQSALERERAGVLFNRARARALAPEAAAVLAAMTAIATDDAGALEAAARLEPTLAPVLARARDVVGGRFESDAEPLPPPTPAVAVRAHRYAEILDVVAGLRTRPYRAADALRSLAGALERGEPVPGTLLGVAHDALAHELADVRAAAIAVVGAWLSRPRPRPPPRGYLALADALATLGREDLAGVARRAAVALREPGARDALGGMLARRGWELAAGGERHRALEALREARSLMQAEESR